MSELVHLWHECPIYTTTSCDSQWHPVKHAELCVWRKISLRFKTVRRNPGWKPLLWLITCCVSMFCLHALLWWWRLSIYRLTGKYDSLTALNALKVKSRKQKWLKDTLQCFLIYRPALFMLAGKDLNSMKGMFFCENVPECRWWIIVLTWVTSNSVLNVTSWATTTWKHTQSLIHQSSFLSMLHHWYDSCQQVWL